ncbi:MAG: translation elongation factor Ts [Brevinematales bacterium]|nr:translation elongation factor Ts [Brevinematales bacterium]
MEISAAMIKEVREKTGAGIVDCKQALTETNGDIAKAIDILKKKGLAKASKKEGRTAVEGIVMYTCEGNKGLLFRLNCETDFVGKTPEFKAFAEKIMKVVFSKAYPSSESLPEDVEQLRKEAIANFGENILVSWKWIEAKGTLYPYVHLNKVASITDFGNLSDTSEVQDVAKKIAMQITSMNPLCVSVDTLPADVRAEMQKSFEEEARATGKPEKVIENIVKGKFEKYYAEVVLMEQPFIFDEEKKVKDLFTELKKSTGIDLIVHQFIRLSLQ